MLHFSGVGMVCFMSNEASCLTRRSAFKSRQNTKYDDHISLLVLHLPWLFLMEAKLLILNPRPGWCVTWPGPWLTQQHRSAMFSCLPADMSKKMDFRRGREKRLSGMRRGVSLPRSIGESNLVLMFHSSLCLFYVFTFYFKCLFIWHRQKALKMLTNSV